MNPSSIAFVLLQLMTLLLSAAALWAATRPRTAEDQAREQALELLRRALSDQLEANRRELLARMDRLDTLKVELATLRLEQERSLLERFQQLSAALASGLGEGRTEQQATLVGLQMQLQGASEALRSSVDGRLGQLQESLAAGLAGLQAQVQERLSALQASNEERLEKMRVTVDEKLQGTLEARLGESFRQVAERLEQVQKGLGEMQSLAADVGGLKRALTNVKSRGVMGEAQLGALLEQYLAPTQYEANVRVRPRAAEHVEFAVKLPGAEEGRSVWLPIDAKFPIEDYQRLMEAYEAGDKAAVEAAGKALETRLLGQAREIQGKYVSPPHTTDFALMFLPFEGLYAEALRRPGLLERLQQEHRVTLVGPTTLTAFLNSLQVGFKTLAISKQSGEVWKVLSAVKGEFVRFGDSLAAVQKKLDEAGEKLGDVAKRRDLMERRLAKVESLPEEDSKVPLPGLQG